MALIRNNMDGAQSRRRRGDDGRYMEDGGYARRSAYDAYNEYGGVRQEYDMAMDDDMYDSPRGRQMGFERRYAYDVNDNDIRRRNTGRENGYFSEQGEHARYPVSMHLKNRGGMHINNVRTMGGMQGGMVKPLTMDTAEKWVRSMKNEDENREKGECWSIDEVKEIAEKMGMPTEGKKLIEFYAAINAMYSDYYKVAEKFDLVEDDFFAEMAKAFIEDKDAVKDKVAAYYQYIVKK
ncbi:MAG: hypothetical protein IJ418_12110 [Clostridia bacterium]|nr:hypothetical protein [Clostridia bacterium]